MTVLILSYRATIEFLQAVLETCMRKRNPSSFGRRISPHLSCIARSMSAEATVRYVGLNDNHIEISAGPVWIVT